ncbi:hypothetical protein JG688_00006575 [Phytophthora aleatoria]|uniref:Expansin-like EG45 domain-containing protein n=1 Tax=Phytophthora aleatoria TaxID=2496075 RepID=A0A8J5IQJ1_9STRA|nr:hypothetical protein JG688_00006575 [Phytophthora aleatoria]
MVFRTLAGLSFTAAVASAEYYEGDGTSYTLGDISSGNCNFMSAIPTASTNYAALNNDQWDNLANCGRCAEVSCIDDQCADQTTTAIVQILDRCPECSSGDLDLSPTVFKHITGSDPSRLTIRWKFVDCPNPGNIEVCLKSGSNGYYVAVQPTNTLVGVETVTINGESTTMVDSAYYYLIESTSDVDLTSVAMSITSVEGETVEGTYSLTADDIAPTNYAALNNEQWNNLGNCGRCAQVSCIDEACADQTASAIVQIVDRCPECKYGDLDLSPSVFKTITGSDPSRLSIRWQFVDCPNPETVKICLKTGSNGFWVAVQPTNAVIGVKSVSINGISASMINGAYYYLITSTSEVDLTAVDVSVTSINGQVIEGAYSFSLNECPNSGDNHDTCTNSRDASPYHHATAGHNCSG